MGGNGNRNDSMGIGRNGNNNSHFQAPLIQAAGHFFSITVSLAVFLASVSLQSYSSSIIQTLQ